MTDRLRVLMWMARPWMARPAVVLLFGLFAATGVAQAGAANDPAPLFGALVVVAAFLLCAVAVNDLSDEAIDRVNLPGDPGRPLVVGACGHRTLAIAGATAAGAALAGSLLLEGPAVVVVACGLVLGVSYSVRPVRLADRGVVAALALPAAYVAVPYLVGIFSVRTSLRAADLVLLGGLYVGFVGRILLKDFRDVRGDALFGKRTFLVRHGRSRTCAVSAACWVAGSAMLLGVRGPTPALAAACALLVAAALALLRALSVEGGMRRDERLVSALAMVGRGLVVLVLAHLSMTGTGWGGPAAAAATGAIALVFAGQAWTMVARGPATRLTVPPGWSLERDDAPAGRGGPQAIEQRGGADAERLDDVGRAAVVAR